MKLTSYRNPDTHRAFVTLEVDDEELAAVGIAYRPASGTVSEQLTAITLIARAIEAKEREAEWELEAEAEEERPYFCPGCHGNHGPPMCPLERDDYREP